MTELDKMRPGRSAEAIQGATDHRDAGAISPAPVPNSAPTIDKEPDYRFTLANERTFLAWMRTALALLAGGVAVGQLFVNGVDEVGRRVLGTTCVVLATTVAVGAFTRWRQVQAAMRRDDPLPDSVMVRLTVIGICLSAVICAVLILL